MLNNQLRSQRSYNLLIKLPNQANTESAQMWGSTHHETTTHLFIAPKQSKQQMSTSQTSHLSTTCTPPSLNINNQSKSKCSILMAKRVTSNTTWSIWVWMIEAKKGSWSSRVRSRNLLTKSGSMESLLSNKFLLRSILWTADLIHHWDTWKSNRPQVLTTSTPTKTYPWKMI